MVHGGSRHGLTPFRVPEQGSQRPGEAAHISLANEYASLAVLDALR